jgi:murein DD-endopeptidase MepM/ murein hydrolase activator NlpD
MKRILGLPALLLAGCVASTSPAPAPIAVAPAPAPAPAPAAVVRGDIILDGTPQQGSVLLGFVPQGVTKLTMNGAPVPLAPDGRFVIGFDRDAGSQAELVAIYPGGSLVRRLQVAPRAWRIERVDVPKRPGVTNEEFERLRAPEVARITAARAVVAASDGWRQRFQWPANGRISGLFGSQRVYRGGEAGAYHSGVDVAGGAGAPVTAPADGVVVLAADKPFTLEGNLLIIDHGMGLNSAFLHLSRIDVKEGQRVTRGQRVGAIGATGRASGPHLHWAVKWRDARVDPMLLAGPMPGQDLSRVPVVEN